MEPILIQGTLQPFKPQRTQLGKILRVRYKFAFWWLCGNDTYPYVSPNWMTSRREWLGIAMWKWWTAALPAFCFERCRVWAQIGLRLPTTWTIGIWSFMVSSFAAIFAWKHCCRWWCIFERKTCRVGAADTWGCWRKGQTNLWSMAMLGTDQMVQYFPILQSVIQEWNFTKLGMVLKETSILRFGNDPPAF